MLQDGGERTPVSRPRATSQLVAGFLHLILPVFFLVVVLTATFACWHIQLAGFDLSGLHPALSRDVAPSWGELLLPGVFFVLNLTNRRYGPGLAFIAFVAGVFVTTALAVWALLNGGAVLGASVPTDVPLLEVIELMGIIFVAALVDIYFFDRMRGVPWWQAPFMGSLIGGLVFAGAYLGPAAHSGEVVMVARLLLLVSIVFGWALLQLLPTQILRSLIRPLPGYGGA